ncbi:MAG: universal stress protein [Proteobacteria bacterium]|nr:universal stress protein [Pseudomonadota bacterium]
MLKILVPVDNSRNSQHAVRHVITACAKSGETEVHLLNVQAPFSKNIAQFASRKSRDAFHRDEAEKALRPARRMLDAASIAHTEKSLPRRHDA